MFKKILIGILVLFIIVILGMYLGRNYFVKSAIETGSEYSLKVETNLSSVNLDLSGRSLELNDFKISNPEGFETDFFLNIDQGMLDIGEGSLFDDEIKVDSLILDGINLMFEQKGSLGNFKVLMDNIKNMDMGSSSESNQKLFVKKISVRNIQVDAKLDLMGKQLQKTFKVENILLENVGGKDGATISEVTAKILKTLISKAKVSGKNSFPELFNVDLNRLKDDKVDEVKSEATDKLKALGGSILNK